MKSLLKFITCGSVDDGKSTLIGHMLYDAKLLFSDQERSLELDSKIGNHEGTIDYSLLLDGLMAEREQRITIDVAYRFFTTHERSFIVADTPGHEQYTRNMAVGASFADLAVILVDVTQGLQTQTKRHSRISSLMGIKHFILAVNKMDLVEYDKHRFDEISSEFLHFAADLNLDSIHIIPVSALKGDNVIKKSCNTPWHNGPALLELLEEKDTDPGRREQGFIMPVQRVCRPNPAFRGFQGQIESGKVVVGDEIMVLPGRESARVKKIYALDKESAETVKGQPVTIQLDREVDVSRGSVLVRNRDLEFSSMFTAKLLWMDEDELVVGRSYFVKIGTKILPSMIMAIQYKIDINTGKSIKADRIFKNEISICDFALSEKMVFDIFEKNKDLGGFILIDRITNMTSACGIIEHPLRRSTNVVWQHSDITRAIRSKQKGQKSFTIWFTGLSGSGKSTLANEVEKRLVGLGKHTMLLDGDNIRHGLNKNLGFKEADRVENIRRIAEVSRLMNDAGIIAITSFISPYERDRKNARRIIGDPFLEVFVSTPLEACEKRDVKGLYKKARQGEIPNFTGITAPYEVPSSPDIVIDTSKRSIEASADFLMQRILEDID